jgi:hypothetical protein
MHKDQIKCRYSIAWAARFYVRETLERQVPWHVPRCGDAGASVVPADRYTHRSFMRDQVFVSVMPCEKLARIGLLSPPLQPAACEFVTLVEANSPEINTKTMILLMP